MQGIEQGRASDRALGEDSGRLRDSRTQYQLILISHLFILRTHAQGWGYIEWPAAHHGGVERVRPWQRGEGVRSDELRGGVERTYELMHGGGSVRCAYELMWWRARAYACSIANEGSSFFN